MGTVHLVCKATRHTSNQRHGQVCQALLVQLRCTNKLGRSACNSKTGTERAQHHNAAPRCSSWGVKSCRGINRRSTGRANRTLARTGNRPTPALQQRLRARMAAVEGDAYANAGTLWDTVLAASTGTLVSCTVHGARWWCVALCHGRRVFIAM